MWPCPGGGGVTTFTLAYIWKTLEISLYLAIKPRTTKFCVQLYIVGLHKEVKIYSPRVELIAKGHQFYMSLYREIFGNLVTKQNYGYQFSQS